MSRGAGAGPWGRSLRSCKIRLADGSVRSACERHDVTSGMLYSWRRKAMDGELAGVTRSPAFAEVQISNAGLSASPHSQGNSPIGIELPNGVRLSVDGSVDSQALSRVLGVLAQ